MLLTVLFGNFALEWIVFGLYRLLGVTDAGYEWLSVGGLLPTLLFNLLFAIAIYNPMKLLFEKRAGEKMDEGMESFAGK